MHWNIHSNHGLLSRIAYNLDISMEELEVVVILYLFYPDRDVYLTKLH